MDDIKLRDILVKKPFTRILSAGYLSGGTISNFDEISGATSNGVTKQIVTQDDFLREYEPSGHAINNPDIYKDIIKYDEEHKKYYTEHVVRVSFAFQRIITTKHLMHLCGNDIQFELPNPDFDEKKEKLFFDFKKGWMEKDMEIHFYNCCKSFKITGDTAFVGCMNGGKFFGRVWSYLNGDTIYPHFDSITGKVNVIARKYYDYDDKGSQITEWVEVLDDNFLYRYRKSLNGVNKAINIVKGLFKLDGYTLVSRNKHGFLFCPASYYRDDIGACWSNSQDSSDQYELGFSQLCQNNRAYAFPIMYFKGDEVEIKGDMDGAVKAIQMSSDGEAGFLKKDDASTSFSTQLNLLYKLIYEQSFCVTPPELKSGDLPGVAIKLLYSPAVENAFRDAQELNTFLDGMIDIFKAGYGMEQGKYTEYVGLEVNAWIEPYIHQNMTELMTNLSMGVQNGFISKETASERASAYTKNNEYARLTNEKKEEQQMDLLVQAQQDENSMMLELEKAKKLEGVSSQKSNTGKGARQTDENGNRPNENNWNKWNQSH